MAAIALTFIAIASTTVSHAKASDYNDPPTFSTEVGHTPGNAEPDQGKNKIGRRRPLELTPVDHPPRLAHRALDRAGRRDLHCGREATHALQAPRQLIRRAAGGLALQNRPRLDPHQKIVQRAACA